MNRRSFAMGALTAWGATRVQGANDRVRMGLIGSGGRGRQDWTTFLNQPDIEPVAVTRGMLILLRNGFQVLPEKHAAKKDVMDAFDVKGGDLDAQHARNFLDCVKSHKRPNADFEEGHKSAVMCHLGNISTRLGRSLKWNAAKERVVGDVEANHMLSRPYREPWKLA